MKPRDRAQPPWLLVLALALVMLVAIASIFIIDARGTDLEIDGAVLGFAAVIGWWLPLLAALVLVAFAFLSLVYAFFQSVGSYYLGGPTFGQIFFWQVLLSVAAAVLFVAGWRQRTGREPLL